MFMPPHRADGAFCTGQPQPDAADRASSSSRVQPLPKWRLRRVQEHVAAHMAEPLRLAELAAAAGLSRMHFAAQFRAATGSRPHDYLLTRRIERAMAVMVGVNMPLAELALAVGFQSQSHFSTVFKRFTGQTPAAWRRANREADDYPIERRAVA